VLLSVHDVIGGGAMTNPSKSPTLKRIIASFLLAALAAYIPFAALGAYITWDMTINPPPPPAMWGIGVALCLVVVGPLCALVAGIVGAFLVHYRRFHLGRLAFGVLGVVLLTIVAMLLFVFARALPFEL
jgi:hypothetical protein